MHTFINVYKNIKTSFFNSSENAQKKLGGPVSNKKSPQ